MKGREAEMGSYAPDPEDPEQIQISVHELGHAVVWKENGLRIVEIVHTGDGGVVTTDWRDREWTDDLARRWAIGAWGGFEAEDRWFTELGQGRANRDHSAHDIDEFNHVTRPLKPVLTEWEARRIARQQLDKHWPRLLDLVPILIRDGRITL